MVSSNIMPYSPLLIFMIIILIWYITSTKNVLTESFGGQQNCGNLSYISDCSDTSSNCEDHWSYVPSSVSRSKGKPMRCNYDGRNNKCSYKTNTAGNRVNDNWLCKETPSDSTDTERCEDNRANNKGQTGACTFDRRCKDNRANNKDMGWPGAHDMNKCTFDSRCKDNRANNKDMGWPGAHDMNKCNFDSACKAENEPTATNRVSGWPGSHSKSKCTFPAKTEGCKDPIASNYRSNYDIHKQKNCDYSSDTRVCRDPDAKNYGYAVRGPSSIVGKRSIMASKCKKLDATIKKKGGRNDDPDKAYPRCHTRKEGRWVKDRRNSSGESSGTEADLCDDKNCFEWERIGAGAQYCEMPVVCNDRDASNFNNTKGEKCIYSKKCKDKDASNYESRSKFPSGGNCTFPKKCRDKDASNYESRSKFPSGGNCTFPKKCRDNRADNYEKNSKFPSGGNCNFARKCIKSRSKKNGKYAEGAVDNWPGPHDASLCKYKGCNNSEAVNQGKYDISDETDCIFPKKCKDKNAKNYDPKYENKQWFKNQPHDEKWCEYDKTPPTIKLNDGDEIKINVGTKYNEPGGMVIDDIDETRNIETSEISGLDKINTNTVGQYSVMYNVKDKRGNKAEKERIVNVLDLVAPKVSLVGSKSIRVPVGENSYKDPGVKVTDNYDTDLKYTTSVSGSGSIVNTNKVGEYKVEYSALDSSRNPSNTVSRKVTVFDQVKPTISLKGANPLTIPVGKKYTEYGVNISDNYDKGLKPIISGVRNIKMNVPGNYTVTYKGIDKSGNTTTKTREVKIVDNKPPIIKLNNQDTIYLGIDGKYREYNATVSDNVSNKLKATISGADQIIPGKLGTYYVTYTATDKAGNTATKDRTVIIRDQTAPSIRLKGNKEVEIPQYSEYIERGATVTDNRDKYLAPIISGDTVDTTTRGEYIVKYQGIDRAEVPNKTDVIERLVKVVDKTPPQISLYQPDYPGKNGIDHGDDYIEFKAHAVDDDGVLLDDKVEVNGTVNTNVPGSYTIQYSVTDNSGNKSETIERYVIVNQKPDTVSPQIVLKNPIYPGEKGIEVGIAGKDEQKYIEYGAHAMDDDGTILDGEVQVSGYVDTNIVGEYIVRYSVSDKAGNSAETERIIYVVDTTKPTIELKGKNPMIVPQGTPYIEPGATASDNGKDISSRIKITGHIDTNVEKTYIITYRVKDYNGHISRKKRTVHVIDEYRILCKEPVYRNLACEDLGRDICGGDDVSALYGTTPFHCIFKDYKCQKGPSCGKRPGLNEEDWLQRLGHRYNTD